MALRYGKKKLNQLGAPRRNTQSSGGGTLADAAPGKGCVLSALVSASLSVPLCNRLWLSGH